MYDPRMSTASRIAVFACVAATITGGSFHLAPRAAPLPSPQDAPWIAPPRGGMDASLPQVRALFASGGDHASRSDTPLWQACGRDEGAAQADLYLLRVGNSAWGPVRQVEIRVRGALLEASVHDALPPAPPEPVPGSDAVESELIVPVARIGVQRDALAPLRSAWAESPLWQASQGPLDCKDGSPIALHACIDGRYFARVGSCGPAAQASAERLWQAVTQTLPTPEPAYWRDPRTGAVVAPDRL